MKKYQRQWKLEEIREISGDTQEELATHLNLNATTYRRKTMLNLKLAKCFGLPKDMLKI